MRLHRAANTSLLLGLPKAPFAVVFQIIDTFKGAYEFEFRVGDLRAM